jgi:peptidoglycan/xylan/chitin deacetylase (PgdA/CDA1 family)
VSERTRVALTFDAEHPDRPHCPPGTEERILDALASANVRATFFFQGRWALSHPDIARRIVADGHLVGNHSMYHARMTLLSDDGLRTDIHEATLALGEILGVDPRPWFRTPFGDGAEDARVIAAVEAEGYRNVHWGVEPGDWQPGRSAADVVRLTREGVRGWGDGAIVLLHTWPASTADALPTLLTGLREDGAAFATLDEVVA